MLATVNAKNFRYVIGASGRGFVIFNMDKYCQELIKETLFAAVYDNQEYMRT
jgi:hypothetical protein